MVLQKLGTFKDIYLSIKTYNNLGNMYFPDRKSIKKAKQTT